MKLELKNISYFYKNNQALSNINLSIELDCECVSLVGHNGAGKSTLLNILCGILKDHTGTVTYTDAFEIAYLPFENPIYDELTVKENLLFWFQLYNNEKFYLDNKTVQELIKDFNLSELLNKKVYLLSSGEKRKAALACILLGKSNLLVLDEPFNGLDISSAFELCKLISRYKEKGKSFIISSHQLYTLNKISDHTLILKDGILVYNEATISNSDAIMDTYVKTYEQF